MRACSYRARYRPSRPSSAAALVCAALLCGCGPAIVTQTESRHGDQLVGGQEPQAPSSGTDDEAPASGDDVYGPKGSEPQSADPPDGSDQQSPCIASTVTCSHIPDCNTHLGDDEAACLAAGNPGGCSQEQLIAWCRRRVDPEPTNDWYQLHRQWVAAKCNGGTVSLTDKDGRGVYSCTDAATCTEYRCLTPLVLVFDGGRVTFSRARRGAQPFDLSAAQDGSGADLDWPGATTPWLALDRDGNGRIDSGRELFGSATLTAAGAASDGFSALAALDENGDGWIDGGDPAFSRLLLWADHNGDRLSQPEELSSVVEAGVRALPLTYQIGSTCDARGNCEVERAPFVYTAPSGERRTGTLVDVHLASRRRGSM